MECRSGALKRRSANCSGNISAGEFKCGRSNGRILISPKDVLKAERYARSQDLDVIGYYHSHPEDKAIPSQYDLDHALPVWSYIIVSVLQEKAVDIRSWVMENDRSKFNEEELEISI